MRKLSGSLSCRHSAVKLHKQGCKSAQRMMEQVQHVMKQVQNFNKEIPISDSEETCKDDSTSYKDDASCNNDSTSCKDVSCKDDDKLKLKRQPGTDSGEKTMKEKDNNET